MEKYKEIILVVIYLIGAVISTIGCYRILRRLKRQGRADISDANIIFRSLVMGITSWIGVVFEIIDHYIEKIEEKYK